MRSHWRIVFDAILIVHHAQQCKTFTSIIKMKKVGDMSQWCLKTNAVLSEIRNIPFICTHKNVILIDRLLFVFYQFRVNLHNTASVIVCITHVCWYVVWTHTTVCCNALSKHVTVLPFSFYKCTEVCCDALPSVISTTHKCIGHDASCPALVLGTVTSVYKP